MNDRTTTGKQSAEQLPAARALAVDRARHQNATPSESNPATPSNNRAAAIQLNTELVNSPAVKHEWFVDDGICYLNHAAFGLSPKSVLETRDRWQRKLQGNPMGFFLREMEDAFDAARCELAQFVGCRSDQLVFVDNVTVGMNIAIASFPLSPGDEVLINDHEYGSVRRMWQLRCDQAAAKLVTVRLPDQIQKSSDIVEALMAAVTPRTRVAVFSHVTSPTAMILPVAELCRQLRNRNVLTCVDGAHAPAHIPLDLRQIDCDIYMANCHKWLAAPIGTGFLYVHSRVQKLIRPVVVSFGNSLQGRPSNWTHEFLWLGTRDPSSFLSVPAAIRYIEDYGIERFRTRGHALANYFREQVTAWSGDEPVLPTSSELNCDSLYGCMATMPLPETVRESDNPHMHPLYRIFAERYQIEVPVMNFRGRRHIRVSCPVHIERADLDRLLTAMAAEIPLHN